MNRITFGIYCDHISGIKIIEIIERMIKILLW